MGSQPLGVTDIITEKWYDYDAKYQLGTSKHVVPADIPRRFMKLVKILLCALT